MSFEWRSEWSAYRVALVGETARCYIAWLRRSSEEWDTWEEYGPEQQRRLEDQFAGVLLAQDEARVELLRRGIVPQRPPKDVDVPLNDADVEADASASA